MPVPGSTKPKTGRSNFQNKTMCKIFYMLIGRANNSWSINRRAGTEVSFLGSIGHIRGPFLVWSGPRVPTWPRPSWAWPVTSTAHFCLVGPGTGTEVSFTSSTGHIQSRFLVWLSPAPAQRPCRAQPVTPRAIFSLVGPGNDTEVSFLALAGHIRGPFWAWLGPGPRPFWARSVTSAAHFVGSIAHCILFYR